MRVRMYARQISQIYKKLFGKVSIFLKFGENFGWLSEPSRDLNNAQWNHILDQIVCYSKCLLFILMLQK